MLPRGDVRASGTSYQVRSPSWWEDGGKREEGGNPDRNQGHKLWEGRLDGQLCCAGPFTIVKNSFLFPTQTTELTRFSTLLVLLSAELICLLAGVHP